MATALQAEARFSQMLQCPICLDTFKRPNILPCGHTYCASCLHSHISNKVTQRGTPQVCFPCPVCRADTPSPDPSINIEQWAESFPVNSIVSSLLDVSVGTNAGKYCDHCVRQGKESLATCFCKDCDQSMCMTCKQNHDGFPSLSRHYVMNVSDGDESYFVIPTLSAIKVCPKHSGKNIEFFCGDHKTLCCNSCVILEHRKCDRVIVIYDMLKTFNDKKISKEVEANLCKLEDHLKQITRKIKITVDTIQKDKADILQHIHSLKAQLIAKLQKLEDDVIASLESNYKSENINLQTQETRRRSLISAIGSDRTQLELVIKHGSEVQKFIMLHNLNQNQHRYCQAISEYQKSTKEIRMSLDVDKTVQIFVNTISELGKINLIYKDFDWSPCPDVLETQFQSVGVNGPARTSLKEGKAVKVSEFNVKVSGDYSVCHISDILHLKDTRLLLIDRMNCKIKMVGQDYTCKEYMTFQTGPWSACSLSDTEVAVTIPDQKTIQIIGIKDKILKVREIRTRRQCRGISVVKDQLMITTYNDEHSVVILDMLGTEIMTVRTDTYQSEKLIDPLYIKTHTTNPDMCISYHTGHKLVAYNMTWNVLFTYMDPDMATAAGIDTDREGNIYLCGYSSRCVQQISAEGKLIKTLISKKAENKSPLMIRFYNDKDSCIVTYGNCDVVEVYDLRV